MRILLVEDDDKIASFIVKGFKAEGFAIDHAAEGEMGLHLALTEPYDAAIIDLMLPKLDGLSLIDQMRREKIETIGRFVASMRSGRFDLLPGDTCPSYCPFRQICQYAPSRAEAKSPADEEGEA